MFLENAAEEGPEGRERGENNANELLNAKYRESCQLEELYAMVKGRIDLRCPGCWLGKCPWSHVSFLELNPSFVD